MWSIRVIMKGDEPDEATVEKAEEAIVDALDAADFDYEDVSAS
jgi:hypothetical protein